MKQKVTITTDEIQRAMMKKVSEMPGSSCNFIKAKGFDSIEVEVDVPANIEALQADLDELKHAKSAFGGHMDAMARAQGLLSYQDEVRTPDTKLNDRTSEREFKLMAPAILKDDFAHCLGSYLFDNEIDAKACEGKRFHSWPAIIDHETGMYKVPVKG